jgi:hypothetical protein
MRDTGELMDRLRLTCIIVAGLLLIAAADTPAFSIKVSADGRSFTDDKGAPWFMSGDTQWELMRIYSVADAKTILDKRASQGFNAFLVMFNGVPNSNSGVAGARPWLNNNPLTPNAKYFAHELTKRCSADSVAKLAGALVDAQVDLNQHQIDAALFAFKSPLS